MFNFSIDLHCHPGQRPFSRSFKFNPDGQNSPDKSKSTSIWYYDPPSGGDIVLQKVAGFTKFSQSNMQALAYGNVRCICASLYPIERGFVRLITGTGGLTDFLVDLVGSLGKERIDYLQAMTNYFDDVEKEYNYYKQLNGKPLTFADGTRQYVLIKNFRHLEEEMAKNEKDDGIETIYVIISIEGLHVLNTGFDHEPNETEVLGNLDKLKNWEHKPFFVKVAHHFYNHLCGHAESLSDFLQDFASKQEPGMNTGFTDIGWKVIKGLLNNDDNRRILVDLKHMSYISRTEYIAYLKKEHAAEFETRQLPLVISHGACNGRKSAADPNPTPGLQTTASRMYDADINFYDDEIVEVAKSGGIMGLQLDERRIASKRYKQSLRLTSPSKTKRRHSNSKMLWNNIQHIVELLDQHDMFAWDCIAIGSDFDGIIDPVNLFWTQEDTDDLIQYIERHAHNYLKDESSRLKNKFNVIDASEVTDRIFHHNAYEFFRKHFH